MWSFSTCPTLSRAVQRVRQISRRFIASEIVPKLEGMSTPSPEASNVLFREKLWPSAGTWIWPLLIAITAGVAIAPISVPWGIATGLIVLVAIVVIFLLKVPTLEVTAENLTVGRATIERNFVGEAVGYRGEEAFKQRGQKLHGLAFMNLRGWLDAVVCIEVTDPRDETPYWITSTRRPEELTAALNGVMYEYTEEGQRESASHHAEEQGEAPAEKPRED